MDMSPAHQVWPKPSCKAQWKGEEDKADRGRGGKATEVMNKPGVRQVKEGSGEQGKMEETGREIICGAPTTPVVEGQVHVVKVLKPCRDHGHDDHNNITCPEKKKWKKKKNPQKQPKQSYFSLLCTLSMFHTTCTMSQNNQLA